MKTFCLTFLILFATFRFSFAQKAAEPSVDKEKTLSDTLFRKPWSNEAILSLSYFGGGIPFGLVYKRQVADRRYFRLSLVNVGFLREFSNSATSSQFPTRQTVFNISLNMGVEWRFRLHKKVWLYTGVDVLAGLRYYSYEVVNPALPNGQRTNNSASVQVGLAFNSGFIFKVHELVRIGLNFSPDIYYSNAPWTFFNENGEQFKGVNHSVRTSLSSGAIQAHVIFHWKRKPYKLKRRTNKSE